MEKINIAFCNRPSYDNPLGGDAVQMLKTKEWLMRLFDCNITIITNHDLITKEFDIIHVFNFITCDITEQFILKARKLNIPIVSSCIYWDYSYSFAPLCYLFKYPSHIRENTVLLFRFLYKCISFIVPKPFGISNRFRKYVRDFVDSSDLILPNSSEEGKLLLDFANKHQSINKIRVVYNGVEFNRNNIIDEKVFFSKYNIPQNYILQVGRIEFLKNQLNLLYSLLEHSSIPLVFVGQVKDEKYAAKLKMLANKRGNVYFIDRIPHEEMPSFYYYAKLHVLLSLRESPGLSSMEAMSLGCPIIISSNSYLPKETYFPNAPYSVNPFDIRKIRNVILLAYKEQKTIPFNMSKFSWNNVAIQTYNAYKEILSKTESI